MLLAGKTWEADDETLGHPPDQPQDNASNPIHEPHSPVAAQRGVLSYGTQLNLGKNSAKHRMHL